MRFVIRVLAVAMVGLAFTIGGAHRAEQAVHAQTVKDTPHVTIFDSNASFTPGNEYLGNWGYGPSHLTVMKGDQITFDNPASNSFPHTVTSITWTGMPQSRILASGMAFNSSPSAAQFIMPGASYVLDTGTLDPGQYVYYCTIHPWMVGTLTVEPAS